MELIIAIGFAGTAVWCVALELRVRILERRTVELASIMGRHTDVLGRRIDVVRESVGLPVYHRENAE